MTKKQPAKKAAKVAVKDRGESIGLMEPLVISDGSRHRGALTDLALELAQKSAGFRRSLPESLLAALADLVRSMNCYYSNLIEGHHTHPIDIDRALAGDYSAEPEKRNLQLEARAHIDVQRKIDAGSSPQPATSVEFIRWVHKEFCQQLPEELLVVSDPATGRKEKVIPGELRQIMVKVGHHIPPAPDDLAALL